MKNISEITNGLDLRKNANSETTELNEKDQKLLNALFVVLEQHVKYFRLNKSRNQEEMILTKREWGKTFIVNKFNMADISIGVEIIRKSEITFDDLTPMQFMTLCKQKVIPASHRDFIPLEQLPSSKETCKSHLDELKKILKIKK